MKSSNKGNCETCSGVEKKQEWIEDSYLWNTGFSNKRGGEGEWKNLTMNHP